MDDQNELGAKNNAVNKHVTEINPISIIPKEQPTTIFTKVLESIKDRPFRAGFITLALIAALVAIVAGIIEIPNNVMGWFINGTILFGKSANNVWQPPEIPKDYRGIFVNVGKVTSAWNLSWLQNPTSGPVPIDINGFKPIRPYVKNNRLYINAEIPAPFFGQIKISGENFSQIPPHWDVNTNALAIEIVDDNTNPVFQMFYDQPDRVSIAGIFTDGKTVVAIRDGQFPEINSNATPKWLGLKPIFKYPASRNAGKLAD